MPVRSQGVFGATSTTMATRVLRASLLPLALTFVMWLLRSNDVSLTATAYSCVLATFASTSYFRWREGGDDSSIPLFALVAAMFWLSFSLPLFWGREMISGLTGQRQLPAAAIETAMGAAVLGVAAMWLGHNLHFARRGSPRELLLFRSSPNSHTYLWAVIAASMLVSHYIGSALQISGVALTQPIRVMAQFLPLPAFALLLLEYQRGRFTRLDKIGVPLYLIARTGLEMASGWLGSTVAVGVVAVLAYAMKWRRLPVVPVTITFLVVIFLQPGKQAFRTRYWNGSDNAGVFERMYGWVSESGRLWSDALAGENAAEWKELGIASVGRLDILHQSANVFDYTPSIIPYQYGKLYSFLFVTLIPRFVWPNKPSVNDANRWYQVTYGLTRKEDLAGVSIACGFLTESYINFGWPGVFLIMLAMGIFLDFFERIFLAQSAGLFFNAVGLALVPSLMIIEGQLSAYLGGMIQMVVFTTVALLPVLVWYKTAIRRTLRSTAHIVAAKRAQMQIAAHGVPRS